MIRVLVILGLLCLYLPAQSADPVRVTFPETTYDFGSVKQGSKVIHSFAVKNNAAVPLAIKSVQLSIPGINARFRPVVPPHGEGTITLEWDTSRFSGEMDGEATVLFGDNPEQRETLLLKAVVQPRLEVLPYPAIFLSAFQGEDKETRLKIVNNEEALIGVSLSPTGSKHFSASLATIEPGKTYELVTRIPPGTLPGRYDEELHLSTDNAKFAGLTVPVHIFVKPDLYANPETIDFGVVSAEAIRNNPSVRELLTQTFLVKKRSGEFEIKKVRSDLEIIEVEKDPVNGKSSTYRVNVALNPAKIRPGKIAGSVELVTNDKDFPLIRVPVAGTVF